ncbi:MAG: hypothetical protein M1833_007408 [Piccolia ochrophora]|nr:MAG: hypothetical protein M1833_007408 [Piccolia ochrophora]
MFGFSDEERPSTKCYVTHGALPPTIDPQHPPLKKRPCATILSHKLCHSAELILPEEVYDAVWAELNGKLADARYSRLTCPLEALLQGDFFNTFIKTGNVLMISEGRAGVDNTYSLCDGVLRLSLDKETYERAGLVGKPSGTAKMQRKKGRWGIEIDLRLPSMIQGKPRFGKILWACKNVLNNPMNWLFCDLSPSEASQMALALLQPSERVCSPQVQGAACTLVPPLEPPPRDGDNGEEDLRDYAVDFIEWLGMVSLDSPRISSSDDIDPYLSRYEVPGGESRTGKALVRVVWRGLLASGWINKLWLESL